MIKEVYYSTKAKKDLKRLRNNEKTLSALYCVLGLICKGEDIPPKYKPHILKGNYAECMECHIESDTLLIWIETSKINIIRIGTHSELFSK